MILILIENNSHYQMKMILILALDTEPACLNTEPACPDTSLACLKIFHYTTLPCLS